MKIPRTMRELQVYRTIQAIDEITPIAVELKEELMEGLLNGTIERVCYDNETGELYTAKSKEQEDRKLLAKLPIESMPDGIKAFTATSVGIVVSRIVASSSGGDSGGGSSNNNNNNNNNNYNN